MANKKPPKTNLQKVRAWKGRLFYLGMKNKDLAAIGGISMPTVTRWLNPDKYGLPDADSIDKVESWLYGLEEERGGV